MPGRVLLDFLSTDSWFSVSSSNMNMLEQSTTIKVCLGTWQDSDVLKHSVTQCISCQPCEHVIHLILGFPKMAQKSFYTLHDSPRSRRSYAMPFPTHSRGAISDHDHQGKVLLVVESIHELPIKYRQNTDYMYTDKKPIGECNVIMPHMTIASRNSLPSRDLSTNALPYFRFSTASIARLLGLWNGLFTHVTHPALGGTFQLYIGYIRIYPNFWRLDNIGKRWFY